MKHTPKRFLALLLSLCMILTLMPVTAFAEEVVPTQNGVTIVTDQVRDDSVFDMQSSKTTTYFCANGIPIEVNAPSSGSGGVVTWTYGGTEYSYTLPQNSIIVGGGWDTPVEGGTSITVKGGNAGYYGIFGGGVKEAATVTGDVNISILGGTFYDGIVGGGINGDVKGNINLSIGPETNAITIHENIIGGGFYGDVEGNITMNLNAGKAGQSVDASLYCGGGVFGDVTGNITINVDGAKLNGELGGGSMIQGKVTGKVTINMNSGEINDIIAGGLSFYYGNKCDVVGYTEINVKGGTVKETICSGSLVGAVTGTAAVNITGGTVGSDTKLSGHTYGIYAGSMYGAEKSTVGSLALNISGNSVIKTSCDDSILVLAESAEAEDPTVSVAISGGQFKTSNEQVKTAVTEIVQSSTGGSSRAQVNQDGTISVVSAVAKIGETSYFTLNDAVAAAQNGETIKMLSDYTIKYDSNAENYGQVCISDKTITLDLNGKTISNKTFFCVEGNTNLTITDSSSDESGMITGTALCTVPLYVEGNNNVITLEKGTLKCTDDQDNVGAILVAGGNGTAINIKGGKLIAGVNAIVMNGAAPTDPSEVSVSVTGGVIDAKHVARGVNNDESVDNTVVITGGTFKTDDHASYLAEGYATVDNGDGTWSTEKALLKDAADNSYDNIADAVAAVTKDNPLVSANNAAWDSKTPVYYNGNFYSTLALAIDAACAANDDTAAKIYIRPGFKSVGVNAHDLISTSIAIYGNNAELNNSWEPSVEYPILGDTNNDASGGQQLTKDITFEIYNLHNGAGAWGMRTSDKTVNVIVENCNNVHQVLINGASGTANSVTNITVKNCTFDSAKYSSTCPVTTTNAGTVTVENCSFKDVASDYVFNINNKNGGETVIVAKNLSFDNCGTNAKAAFRLMGEAKGSSINATLDNISFTNNTGKISDIVIGNASAADNQATVIYSVTNTAAKVQSFTKGSDNKTELTFVAAETYSGKNLYTVNTGTETTDTAAVETAPTSTVVSQNVETVITDNTAKEAFKQNTKVSGVVLTMTDTYTPAEGGDKISGLQAVVDKAAEQATDANKTALAEAANISVEVVVEAKPTEFEANGTIKLDLVPKATVYLGETPAQGNIIASNIPVANDMIDQTKPITVQFYTGYNPAQVIHTADDGSIIDVFSGSDIGYNESTGTATVTISHFSGLTAVAKEQVAKIGEVLYSSLGAAFNAAQSGETIELLKDAAMTDALKAELIAKNLTVNSGEFKLTLGEVDVGFGTTSTTSDTLTLKGDSTTGSLYIGQDTESENVYKVNVYDSATLGQLYIRQNGQLNIIGATVTSDYPCVYGQINVTNKATYNVNASNFYLSGREDKSATNKAIITVDDSVLDFTGISLEIGGGTAGATRRGSGKLELNKATLKGSDLYLEPNAGGSLGEIGIVSTDSVINLTGYLKIGEDDTVSLDNSTVTAKEVVNNGTITVDVSKALLTNGKQVVIDYTGTGTPDYGTYVATGADADHPYVLAVVDKDLCVIPAPIVVTDGTQTLYLSSINDAFAKVNTMTGENVIIKLTGNVTEEMTADYEFNKNVTITADSAYTIDFVNGNSYLALIANTGYSITIGSTITILNNGQLFSGYSSSKNSSIVSINSTITSCQLMAFGATVNIGADARVTLGFSDGLLRTTCGGVINITGTAFDTNGDLTSVPMQLKAGYVNAGYAGANEVNFKNTYSEVGSVAYDGTGSYTVTLDGSVVSLSNPNGWTAFNMSGAGTEKLILTNNSKLIANGTVGFDSNTEVSIAAGSVIKANGVSNSGTITVDVSNFTLTGDKQVVIDYTGSGTASYGNYAITGADADHPYVLKVIDGDLCVVKAAVVVTGGTDIFFFSSINDAFAKVNEMTASDVTVKLTCDVTEGYTAKNTFTKNVLITADEPVVLDLVDNSDDTISCASGYTLTLGENVTIDNVYRFGSEKQNSNTVINGTVKARYLRACSLDDGTANVTINGRFLNASAVSTAGNYIRMINTSVVTFNGNSSYSKDNIQFSVDYLSFETIKEGSKLVIRNSAGDIGGVDSNNSVPMPVEIVNSYLTLGRPSESGGSFIFSKPVSITGNSTVIYSDSNNTFTFNGGLTIDATSQIKTNAFTNNGTITVDVSNFTLTGDKQVVIDYTGSGTASYGNYAVLGADADHPYVLKVIDGDLCVVKAAVVVTGGTDIFFFSSINDAFAKVNEMTASDVTVKLTGNISETVSGTYKFEKNVTIAADSAVTADAKNLSSGLWIYPDTGKTLTIGENVTLKDFGMIGSKSGGVTYINGVIDGSYQIYTTGAKGVVSSTGKFKTNTLRDGASGTLEVTGADTFKASDFTGNDYQVYAGDYSNEGAGTKTLSFKNTSVHINQFWGHDGAVVNVTLDNTYYVQLSGTEGRVTQINGKLTMKNNSILVNNDNGVALYADSEIAAGSMIITPAFTNSATLTVDMAGATDAKIKLIDYTGTGTMNLESYGNVSLKNGVYILRVEDNDLYAVKIEAKIGNVNYETLKGAIAAATAGDTIYLLQDVAIDDTLIVNKAVTIDGQGHKIHPNTPSYFENKSSEQTAASAAKPLITVNVEGVTLKDIYFEARAFSRHDMDITNGVTTILDDITLDHQDHSSRGNDSIQLNGKIIVKNNLTIKLGASLRYYDDRGSKPNNDGIAAPSWGGISFNSNDSAITFTEGSTFNGVNVYNETLKVYGQTQAMIHIARLLSNGSFDEFNKTNIDLAFANVTGAEAVGLVKVIGTGWSMTGYEVNNSTFLTTNYPVVYNGTYYQSLEAVKSYNGLLTSGTINVDPAGYVAVGYKATDNGNGTWTVSLDETHTSWVAKVNGIGYTTLESAYAAANTGDTITLLADIAATQSPATYANECAWSIEKSITLDGNGKKITVDANNWAKHDNKPTGSIFNIGTTKEGDPSAVVTIKNLEIVGDASCMKHCISVTSEKAPTTAIIENVKTSGGSGYGVVCNNSTVIIKGADTDIQNGGWGAVNADKANAVLTIEAGSIGTVNAENGKTELTGGTIAKAIVSDTATLKNSGATVTAVPDGYYWCEIKDSQSKKLAKAEASIGEAYYETFAEAYAAAADGNTIKLLANVTTTALTIEKNVTIDLGTKTLTDASGITVDSAADVTFTNGAVAANITNNGTVTVSAAVTGTLTNNGTATVNAAVTDIVAAAGSNTEFGASASAKITSKAANASVTKPSALVITDIPEGCSWCETDNYGTQKLAIANAKIGTAMYETFSEALGAAADGNTITLINDVTLGSALTIAKNVTIDLGGKTLTDDEGITVASEKTVTLKNGIVNANITNNGTVTVSAGVNGTLTNNGIATVNSTVTTVVAAAGTTELTANAATGIISIAPGAEVTKVTGTSISQIPSGYSWCETETAGTQKLAKADAKIGTAMYETFSEALGAAADGNTITLINDVTIGSALTIAKNVTIDLGGKTLSDASGITTNNATGVTFKNGTVAANITNNGKVIVIAAVNGTLTNNSTAIVDAAVTDIVAAANSKTTLGINASAKITSKAANASVIKPIKLEITDIPEGYSWCYEESGFDQKLAIADAKIGTTMYETFSEALGAAQPGDTITLINDVTDGHALEANNVTIDLNGKTLTATSGIRFSNRGILTFTNGTVAANITTENKGTVIISAAVIGDITNNNNGTVTINAAVTGDITNNGTVTINAAVTGTLTNNGTATVNAAVTEIVAAEIVADDEYSKTTLGENANTKISSIVPGAKVTKVTGATVSSIPEGYSWCETTTAGTQKLAKAAAEIGDAKYETFAEAYAAAQSGDTIKLLADMGLASAFAIAKTITIDLNGKTLSKTGTGDVFTLATGAALTIGGGTVNADITATTITGGTFSGAVNAGTITGGTFSGTVNAEAITGGFFNGAVEAPSVKGGTFSAAVNAGTVMGGTFSAGVTAQYITDGTFEGNVTVTGTIDEDHAGSITGGTFKGTVTAPEATIIGGSYMNEPDAKYIVNGYTVVGEAAPFTIEVAEIKIEVNDNIAEPDTANDEIGANITDELVKDAKQNVVKDILDNFDKTADSNIQNEVKTEEVSAVKVGGTAAETIDLTKEGTDTRIDIKLDSVNISISSTAAVPAIGDCTITTKTATYDVKPIVTVTKTDDATGETTVETYTITNEWLKANNKIITFNLPVPEKMNGHSVLVIHTKENKSRETFTAKVLTNGTDRFVTINATEFSEYKLSWQDVENSAAMIESGDKTYYYDTLENAIKDAELLDEIKLIKGVQLSSALEINKNVILELNGKTIMAPFGITTNVNDTEGIVLKGGTIEGTVTNKGFLTVNGVDVSAIKAQANSRTVLKGTMETEITEFGSNANVTKEADVNVKSIPDGAVWKNNELVGAAAKVGDTYYSTLQEAVDAVANEGSITLLSECSGPIIIGTAKLFTIIPDVYCNVTFKAADGTELYVDVDKSCGNCVKVDCHEYYCVANITNADPANGTFTAVVSGKDMGKLTLEKASNGWYLKDANGNYIGRSGNSIVHEKQVWQYAYGKFYQSVTEKVSRGWVILNLLFGRKTVTTDYYLAAASAGAYTINTSALDANFVLNKTVVEPNHSDAPAYKALGNGTHVKICAACGETLGEPQQCTIKNGACTLCGAANINYNGMFKINVNVRTTNLLFFKIYTATASVSSELVGIKSVKLANNVGGNALDFTTGKIMGTKPINDVVVVITTYTGESYAFNYHVSNGAITPYTLLG